MKPDKEQQVRDEIREYLSDGPKTALFLSNHILSEFDISRREYNILIREMKFEGVINTKLTVVSLAE